MTAKLLELGGGFVPPTKMGGKGVPAFLNAKTDGHAVGDGVADDSAAIEAAIAAARAADLPLFIPTGTYKLGSTVVITDSNVRIYGSGSGSAIVFDSTAREAIKLVTGISEIEIHSLFFQGDASDDKDVNGYGAIWLSNGNGLTTDLGVTDVTVHHCTFDHCTPIETDDSFHTSRLHFASNLVHNFPNGLHPPSNSTIEDCDFINDAQVATRSEAIYQYGQQCDLAVLNSRFINCGPEPAVQIRSTGPRFDQRFCFRIEGNHFENAAGYGIWCGSDDHPDISDFVITGNTFRNCGAPMNVRGAGIIANNDIMWDWEYPFSVPGSSGTGVGIAVLGGQGASGARSTVRGVQVSNNRLIHRHPWVGKITVDTVPANNDTVTVGAFVYTWKAALTPAEGEVLIGVDTAHCAANLAAAIQGIDGRMTAPNNVLRNVTDCFYNALAADNSETNGNLVVVVSWDSFTMSKTGGHVTVDATAVDHRNVCTYAINVSNVIAPIVNDNLAEDFDVGIAVSYCVEPTIIDNVLSIGVQNGSGSGYIGIGNARSMWSRNRIAIQYPIASNGNHYSICADAFPVIEDGSSAWQLSIRSMGGRTGIAPVGDGVAFTYLYFGYEQATAVEACTRPWRWDDGDQVLVASDTFTFKRVAPGAGEFNDAASLVTLINASTWMKAAYGTIVNDYAATDPHKYIRVYANAAGAAFNSSSFSVQVARFKKPGDTGTFGAPPLINGVILPDPGHRYASPRGGCNGTAGGLGATKTYVMTPLACPDRPVLVQGVDAASQALAPIVYMADIVPGCGFTITHGASVSGAEAFSWRH